MATKSQGYTPEQRARNGLSIVLVTAAAIGVLVLSGLLQAWSLGSYVVGIVFIVGGAAVFWWLFASTHAVPLPPGRQYARWPFLSKKTLESLKKGN